MKTFQFHFKSATSCHVVIKMYYSFTLIPYNQNKYIEVQNVFQIFYLRAFHLIIHVWKNIKHLNLCIYLSYMDEAHYFH